MDVPEEKAIARRLSAAGCVAAQEEAREIVLAGKDADARRAMVARRITGEPLAWIIGATRFCEIDVAVDKGIYVPRWQTELLARRAAELLPQNGIAVDLCTGSGAIAAVMQSLCPKATVVATELDSLAASCARRNGVTVFEGDLDEPLPDRLLGHVDVMVGCLPYVPTDAMHLLPRDVQRFEPRMALDGGTGGLRLVRRAILCSAKWLRPKGWIVLEVGSDQIRAVQALLHISHFDEIAVVNDGDDDERGLYGRYMP